MQASFLNVDLELTGPEVGPVVAAFADRVVVLHQTHEFAALELNGIGPLTADEAVEGFAALVGGLPRGLRAKWNALQARVLDLGIEAGDSFPAGRFSFSPASVAAAARMRAVLAVTVYPAQGRAEKGKRGRPSGHPRPRTSRSTPRTGTRR